MMKNLRFKTRKFISQRRARRLKINNKINNKLTYNYRGNVQTYGPGYTVVNIDYDIRRDITGEQLLDYTIQQLLTSSDQFYKYREQYNLFKITNFYVIMFPDDNANNENTYLNVDWFNTINIDNIQTCEWSKIMYNDRKSRVTFRFKPLNMNIEQYRVPDTAVINPRQYISTSSIASYPGHIKIYHNGDTKIRCKIVFRVLFRRPEPPAQPEEVEPNVISRVEKELDDKDIDLKNINNKNKIDKNIKNNNNNNKKRLKVIKQEDIDNSFQEVNKSLNKCNNILFKLKNHINNKDNDNKEEDQKKYDYLRDKLVIILRKLNNIKKHHKIKDQKTIDKWRNFIIKQQFKKLKDKEDKKDKEEDLKEDIKTDDNNNKDEKDNHGLNQSSIMRFADQINNDCKEYKHMKILDRDVIDRIRKKKDKEEEELSQSISNLFDDSII